MDKRTIRKTVRECYAQRVKQGSICSCCPQETVSRAIGYTDEQLESIPAGADLGLGCGNPTALASLQEGDVVLDLGSGAGIDCFLAANTVGQKGSVIGVDMTPEMIEKARDTAQKNNYQNVEFRLGEIENLPVADSSIDVVVSNCVINLSPDKPRVFRETYRVLKPGGRMIVSDIVLLKALPDEIRDSIEAYVGCVAGAAIKDEYLASIEAAGFQKVEILREVSGSAAFSGFVQTTDPDEVSPSETKELAASIASITVRAIKAQ